MGQALKSGKVHRMIGKVIIVYFFTIPIPGHATYLTFGGQILHLLALCVVTMQLINRGNTSLSFVAFQLSLAHLGHGIGSSSTTFTGLIATPHEVREDCKEMRYFVGLSMQ